MKPLIWKRLLFLAIVATCYVVHGLDAKGCRFLTLLCRGDSNCDRQVLFKKCGHYFETSKKKTGTNNRDDPVAIPPISLLPQWPFLPQAFGKGSKHEFEPAKNQQKPKPQRLEENSQWQTNFYPDSEDNQLAERKIQQNYDEANENWEMLSHDADVVAGASESSRNLRRRFAEDKAYTGEDMRKSNSYHAGVDHHGNDLSLHSEVATHLYSRLVRLAKLQDVLTRQKGRLISKSSDEVNRPIRSDLQYQEPLYKSPELHSEYHPQLHDQRQLEEDSDANFRSGKLQDNFKPADSILWEEPSYTDQGSDDVFKQHEPELRAVARSVEKLSNTEELNHRTVNELNQIIKEDKQINKKKETKSQQGLTADKDVVEKKNSQPASVQDISDLSKAQNTDSQKEGGTLILRTSSKVDPNSLKSVGGKLQKVLWGIDPSQHKIFSKISVDPANNKEIDLRLQVPKNVYSSEFNPKSVADKINTDKNLRNNITKATGLSILHARSKRNNHSVPYALPKDKNWDEFAIITAIVGGCTLALIVASVLICSFKRRSGGKKPIELEKKEAFTDYEELCRTQMAVNAASSPRTMKAIQADRQRHGLVDGQGKVTKKTWREEPLAYNMDISTGHVILSYMEEHLKDENKLSTEWDALCNYKADRDETTVGEDSKNASKNRYSNVLPYDHTRVKLRETSNVFHSDYINASYITDADPRNPAYIATQGPLDNTVADFWQMIWEQGVVVIVNLTRLSDMGLPQCHRYWPEEGSDVYNTYQVHLISEHIWCDDYIVRSFYLKHLLTSETRTVTQFHFLTWPDLSVPESPKPILEFRRKVNKCYRGQACPIVVHCNNGIGRTGTYILIDMVLKKMIKGTKEIDIAATLEYLRDQRPDMVKTKAQFEFTLASVAEEVTAILSSLSS